MSDTRPYHLRPAENTAYEPRGSWTCYTVLHGGEGPCGYLQRALFPQVNDPRLRPDEAAELYAERLDEADDYALTDGDRFQVAVETAPGEALFYSVRLDIERRYEARRITSK